MEELKEQKCPICGEAKLTLTQDELEVPYFGKTFIFSMNCEACKYHKSDVESTEEKDPVKYTFEISKEEDMKVRVIRSSNGLVKIPHIASIEPGEGASGYITNVEGILNRIKHQIEVLKEAEEDEEAKKKAKNMLKKITRIMWGQESAKLIIEDPTGNSAILSDKAEKSKLKV